MIRVLVLLLALFSALLLSAQDGYLQFSTTTGFPSNTVYIVLEDSRGILWIGTDNGLVRWDGSHFKTYTVDDGLPSNAIWMLHEDELGRIWTVNSNDIRYYIEQDSIKVFDQEAPLGVSEKILYMDKGLLTIDFAFKPHALGYSAEWEKDTAQKGWMVDVGTVKLLVGLYIEELVREEELLKIEFDLDNSHTALVQFKDAYWIIQRDLNRVFMLKEGKLELCYSSQKETDRENIPMPLIYEREIVVDHFFGQITIDLERETIVRILDFDDQSINTNRFYQHSSGFIFIASANQGLLIKPELIDFSYQSLEQPVLDMEVGERDMVLKLNNSIVVKEINSKSVGDLELLSTEKNFGFQKKSKHEIILNNRYNAFVYDEHSGALNALFDKSKVNSGNPILDNPTNWRKSIIKEGQMFFMGGSWFMEGVQDKDGIWKYKNVARWHPLYDMELWKDTIFFGSGHGPLQYNGTESPEIISETEHLIIKEVINCNDQCLLLLDHKHVLYRYGDTGLEEVKAFEHEVEDIKLDNDRLYVLTKGNLEVITLSNGRIEENFIWNLEILTTRSGFSCLSTNSSHLFLGCNSGVIGINKGEIKPIVFEPTVYEILAFSNGEPVNRNQDLANRKNNITFQFSARSIESVNQLTYEYRLIPGHELKAKTENSEVVFPNLSHGKYRFELTAIDAFGNRSSTASFEFEISPPWYLTWEAVLIFSGLLLSFIYGWNRWKTKRLRKRAEEIIQFEKQKAVFQLTSIRSQMNPHFIFNTLTVIQDVILQEDSEQAEKHLVKFSRAIRMFLNYSRKDRIKMREEIELLQLYCDLENIRFNNEIKVEWNISSTIDLDETFVPTLLIQPLLENSFNHGLFHKKGDKILKISIDQHGSDLRFEIEDNGVGRNEAKKMVRDERKEYESLGLTLVYERIEVLNKINKFNIQFFVEDLYEKHSVAAGTKAIIHIKEAK